MLRIHKAFLSKLESAYFKNSEPYQHDEPLLDDLVELARGCAREGYTCLVVAPAEGHEPRCLDCSTDGSVVGLLPMRVKNGSELIIGLFCSTCINKSPEKTMRENALECVACDGEWQREPKELETAYLFQHGPRIRIVSGENLEQGILA